jgi:F-type H+-transporting ATPase subunit epsilon
MADQSLHLSIVTQEHELLTQDASAVTVMTVQGEITILPGHIPLFVRLADGELKYRAAQNPEPQITVAVTGGFMDVDPTGNVTVLADYAIRAEDINEAKAEEARQLAEEAMKTKQSDVEFRIAEASLRRALTELRTARKHKGL